MSQQRFSQHNSPTSARTIHAPKSAEILKSHLQHTDFDVIRVEPETVPGLSHIPITDTTDGRLGQVLRGERSTRAVNIFYFTDPGAVIIYPRKEEHTKTLLTRHWLLIATDKSIERIRSGESPEDVMLDDEVVQQISKTRIGVAGTGTVGMNILSATVRQGFGKFAIAELPDERIAGHNLNRLMGATSVDVGKRKIDIATREILLVNPFADVTQYPGITRYNAQAFVEESDVIICALDNVEAMFWIHYYAHQQRKPVLLISDTGSASIFDLYDYRRGDIDQFKGRITYEDLRTKDQIKLVFQVMKHHMLINIPKEMLAFFALRIEGHVDFLAQEVTAAMLTSSFAIEAVTRLITDKDLRETAIISPKRALDTWIQRIKRYPERANVILNVLKSMKQHKAKRS